jgi:hypothetical protein
MLRAEALAKGREGAGVGVDEAAVTSPPDSLSVATDPQDNPQTNADSSAVPPVVKKTVKIKVHSTGQNVVPHDVVPNVVHNMVHNPPHTGHMAVHLKKPIAVRFAHQPRFNVLSMEKAAAPSGDEEGFIVTNPPYGHRLGNLYDSEASYHLMAGLLDRFPSWKIAVITDHPGFESHFGHKADVIRNITNGAIQTYLFIYNNESAIGYRPRPALPTNSEWGDRGASDWDGEGGAFERPHRDSFGHKDGAGESAAGGAFHHDGAFHHRELPPHETRASDERAREFLRESADVQRSGVLERKDAALSALFNDAPEDVTDTASIDAPDVPNVVASTDAPPVVTIEDETRFGSD